jgi:sugar/nucleoside kinase (ribokinase family)
MRKLEPLQPVDYLMIGHIAQDLTPNGPRLGGTAAFSALTARAMGLRVGIVTSWASELPLGPLQSIPVISYPTEYSTTFSISKTPDGRELRLVHRAEDVRLNLIPDVWRSAPIVHLGPIAQELDPTLVRSFPSALIGVTPQGWLRTWDETGLISATEWPEGSFVLNRAGAAVISIEDVDSDEDRIEEMAIACRILAVTEADQGARVYWNGDVRRFRPAQLEEDDSTGAGDIFAAAFFNRLYTTRDPWEAGRVATQLSAVSVTRPGMDGIPTQEEVAETLVEVL